MRLWSLHPAWLDRAGLVAAWREGLLAQAVLAGRTRGYRSHPQLARFRMVDDPLAAVDAWLHGLCDEAARRGYSFDRSKLGPRVELGTLPVAASQLRYEHALLGLKRAARAPGWEPDTAAGASWIDAGPAGLVPRPHPVFTVVPGDVAPWERPRDDALAAMEAGDQGSKR